MQNLACAVGVFTGYISDKGRRFSNIWCLGMICWLFHFIATSFVWVVVGGGGRVCICLTICSRVFSSLLGLYWYYKLAGWDSTELETSCSVCGPSYPFKGWLWDDDICWQKVCHQPSFWVPKNFQICCFIVEALLFSQLSGKSKNVYSAFGYCYVLHCCLYWPEAIIFDNRSNQF